MTAPALRPICYMVMPFRTKRVDEPRPTGAPVEIDFDALWERAYCPAIENMGYLPMRADFDPNTSIVQAMLERIAFADLVLADVTLGNGNCYYEIGVRHVAKETKCVMVAPTWTRPLFDLAQFTSVRFPLTTGTITDDEATVIRELIERVVPTLVDSRTPYSSLLGAALADQGRQSSFRDFAEQLSGFQASIRAIRLERDAGRKKTLLTALLNTLGTPTLAMREVAVELVGVVRDVIGWAETLRFIESLPKSSRDVTWIREQYCLAVAKAGDPTRAIGLLEQLMADLGETPERLGLVGGRYKTLRREDLKKRIAAQDTIPSVDEGQYLDRAIEYYRRGMERDCNEYFCSCNLPSLLRTRGDEGDAEHATVVEHFVVAACERARVLGTGDEYLLPTLLGAAFRSGDITRATLLTRDVEREGPAAWKLATTLGDLRDATSQTEDEPRRLKLDALCTRLARLLEPRPS